ncbi:MAG: hypothetical protein QXD03_02390 [Candidatus Anstonellales archaeon]
MGVRIRIRRDTAANFASVNPVLALGELAYETDTKRFKVGDGTTQWNSLSYLTIAEASDILNRIKTVDGSGSGLDADLLDGYDGSYYTNASNITSGTLDANRLPNSGVTAGTYTKVTVDAKGRVTSGANLAAADIPNLDASKITSGTFPDARIGSVSWSKITGTPTTISGYGITDAYTKSEIDTMIQGLRPKQSVRAATTGNITLSGTQTIDGVSLSAGDRVLVKDQTTQSQNGIYIVSTSNWTRATDADAWDELVSAFVFVEQGTTNADTAWVCTVDRGGTLGTTPVTWIKFAGSGAYQPIDPDLTAIANLTTTGVIVRTGDGSATTRSVTVSGSGISVTNGDGVSGNIQISINSSSSNTANTLVFRDASGNFSAGTITAALNGNATTASKLQTARTISLTGDVTGSTSFDGSSNVSISTTWTVTTIDGGDASG